MAETSPTELYRLRLPFEVIVADRQRFLPALDWCKENIGHRMSFRVADGELIEGDWASTYSLTAGAHLFFFGDDVIAIAFKLMFVG